MIEEIRVSLDMILWAEEEAQEIGRLRGSITNGEGNVYGLIGERIVAERIGGEIRHTYDYDIVKGRWRIDAKTKRCTTTPRPEYECSIAAFNIRQQCDYYVFVRMLNDMSRAWLLGAITKAGYFEQAKFHRAGEIDEHGVAGWTFKADCYNLPISQLRKLRQKEC